MGTTNVGRTHLPTTEQGQKVCGREASEEGQKRFQQKEQQEDGQEPVQGRLIICLRNSTQDGFYDIVFDDNGPGVSGENLTRLFTPNFTTKSGGTGLGLAICRNIVEKCGGTISYRKSFALGGACFTVTIPKTAASSCSVITT